LAQKPEVLKGLRAKLTQSRMRYPLFDTKRLARHIEAAYVAMWERHQRGEPPVHFAVTPLARDSVF